MTIDYNVTGAERKALVTAIGEILEVKPKYLGMPTAAYRVDYITIDRNGMIEFENGVESKGIKNILEQLAKQGFAATPQETVTAVSEVEAAKNTGKVDAAPQGKGVGVTVAVPLVSVTLGNLTKLLNVKGSLIKKAFGIDALPVKIDEENVSFPWFSEMPTADEVQAYIHFISALCEMSRTLKRVTVTEKAVENEKYAFRCFLLRLSFIGAEYKTERKLLLKNLTGSSAFKKVGDSRGE